MGLNVDLCRLLALPKTKSCPRCHAEVATQFDDYDIECGNPNEEPGVLNLSMYCDECEYEWQATYLTSAVMVRELKR